MRIGILGGGLTGLSLAFFLEHDSEVLEKESQCGGLCTTLTKNGFSYDYGGHIIFSKDAEVLDFMVKILGDNVKKYYRNNKVWYKNRFIKYPFENGLYELPKDDKYEILITYIKNDYPEPTNFKEWIYHTFGKGLAEKYLIPYNEKIWNTKTETMGIEWVERVPKPPVVEIIKSAIGIETEGYLHQLYFYYPLRGGIQSLIKSIEEKVPNITRNFEVKKVQKTADKWLVSDGKSEKEFDKIVSTVPIFDLAKAIENLPDEVERAIENLKYNSLIVVLIGVNNTNLSDKFAVYIPQKDLFFHRVCFNRYFGENYVPEGKSSAIAEITVNKGDGVYEMTDAELIDEVVSGLAKEGFIEKKDVCETDVKRREYAYIIYDLDYKRNIAAIYKYFQSIGIELCGRFSEFKYLNMDACIRSAKNLAEKINA